MLYKITQNHTLFKRLLLAKIEWDKMYKITNNSYTINMYGADNLEYKAVQIDYYDRHISLQIFDSSWISKLGL